MRDKEQTVGNLIDKQAFQSKSLYREFDTTKLIISLKASNSFIFLSIY